DEARFATLLARVSEARSSGKAGRGRTDRHSLLASSGSNLALPDGRVSDTVSATQALFAATPGRARALALDNPIGALEKGMQADIVVVSLDGVHQQPVNDPTDALVFSSSGRDVVLTMVAGREVYRDQTSDNAENEYQLRLAEIRNRLDATTSP